MEAIWTPVIRQQHSRAGLRYKMYLTMRGGGLRSRCLRRAVYRWFAALNHAVLAIERDVSPSACIIDSECVEISEAGSPRGYNAGKKIKRRKRHQPKRWVVEAPIASATAFLYAAAVFVLIKRIARHS